jgi:Leucine-rich repeat (LRR) protein
MLNGNQISGSLPKEIGNLTNLIYLNLYGNQLTGAVPTEINNLTKINTISLSENDFDQLPVITLKNAWISLEWNHLTFEDLEPNINAKWYYNKQDSIGVKMDIIRNTGEDYTFVVNCGGAHNFYTWYKNNHEIAGATNSTYTINNLTLSDAGLYRCKVSNTEVTDLDIYSRPIRLIVSGTVDVERNEAYRGIRIYPNPAHSDLTIENSIFEQPINFEIINSDGRKVFESVLESRRKIDVATLSNGLYFVRFKNKGSEYILKFIKE